MSTDETNPGRLLNVEEVGRRLGLSRATVYRRIATGDIPAVRLASQGRGAVRVSEDELEDWLFSNPNTGEVA